MALALQTAHVPVQVRPVGGRLMAAIIGAHFLFLLWLGLSKHWAFMSSLNDMGMFDQAIWGILHGQPFLNTSSPFNQPINWLGWHFNPILVLFIPLYALVEAPEWLILAQAAAISFSAWPLYRLAGSMTGSERAARLWAVAYLANPFLLNGAAWDFHALSLAVPCIALALLAVESRNGRLLLISCLVLLTVQENMGIAVAGFGALWGLRQRAWRLGGGLILAGLAYTCMVIGVVMPALSPSQTHPMLSDGVGFASRYGWLGNSLTEIALAPVLHPVGFVRTLLAMGAGSYLALLFLCFLFYPLAGALFLLPALADLAVNLLSANPMPRSPFSYHSLGLVPILTAAAIHGSRVLADSLQRFSTTGLAGLAAAAGLITGYLLAPLPLPGAADYWAARNYPLRADPALATVQAALPPGVSLAAQANVGAHFSHRHRIHVLPARLDSVDAVLLRLESPTHGLGQERGDKVANLSHHLQMEPGTYLSLVESLVRSPDFGVLLWNEPWLLLSRQRGAADPVVREAIFDRLRGLRSAWRIDEAGQGSAEEGSPWRP